MKNYLEKLPQEIIPQINEYIPRDRDMKSTLSVFICRRSLLSDFRMLKFEIENQETIFDEEGVPEEERVFDNPNMTFFEYYFEHDFNHKHKYRKSQV